MGAVIPAFVTSAVNRYDLLLRMLESIDEPVERGLVCINGPEPFADAELPPLAGTWRSIEVPFGSLGWPGVLNFGIARLPDAPWWLFSNNDVRFSPGALAEMARQMDAADGPLVLSSRWAVFALNAAVVERVGLFDEWSFWPLYFDDTDYAYRCHLAGIPVQIGDFGVLDGDGFYATSLTIHSDEKLARANNRTWIINQAAYVAKWGGRPGAEKFTTPWDSGLPLWVTRPSPSGRVEREWPTSG